MAVNSCAFILKMWIKAVLYFLRQGYFSGGMSGTVLSDFMKSTTSAQIHFDCTGYEQCNR